MRIWRRIPFALMCLAICAYGHNEPSDSGNGDEKPVDVKSDPVAVVSGEVLHEEVDIYIPCPLVDIVFSRRYGSNSDHSGRLGRRWIDTYDWKLTIVDDEVWVSASADRGSEGWGYTRKFRIEPDGSYTPLKQNDYKLEHLAGGDYTLSTRAGVSYIFNSSGRLEQIAHAAGVSLNLTYTNNLLTRVEHANGQFLAFSYTNNFLSLIETPSTNLYVTFSYSDQNVLTNSVRHTSSGESSKTYIYNTDAGKPEHARMTKRISANGDTLNYEYNNIDGADARCVGAYLEPDYYKAKFLHYPPQQVTQPKE